MAPEDTTITSTPRARSEAMSAATPSSHAVRGAASSWSTTRALPIFTTRRCAAAIEGVSDMGTQRRNAWLPLPLWEGAGGRGRVVLRVAPSPNPSRKGRGSP